VKRAVIHLFNATILLLIGFVAGVVLGFVGLLKLANTTLRDEVVKFGKAFFDALIYGKSDRPPRPPMPREYTRYVNEFPHVTTSRTHYKNLRNQKEQS